MNMSRMTPLCGNLHRAVAAGRLWTEIAADLRRSRGRFLIWDARQQCEDHGSSDGSISVDSTGVGRSGEDQNAEGPSAGGGC